MVLNPPEPHFQGSGRIFEFWRAPWEIFTHDIALFRLIFLNFLILNWKIFILSKNVQNTQIRFMMWFSTTQSWRNSLKLAENFQNKNWPAFILHLEIGQATILPYEFDFRGYFLGRGSSKYFPVFFPWKVCVRSVWNCWVCLRTQNWGMGALYRVFSTTVSGQKLTIIILMKIVPEQVIRIF